VNEVKFLTDASLGAFMDALGVEKKYTNVMGDGGNIWRELADAVGPEVAAGLRAERTLNPVKGVFMAACEVVARYGADADEDPLAQAGAQKTAVVGMRGCECRALAYLDMVMLSQPSPDPFYAARRAATTIVSVDCTQPAGTCFCDLLGDDAYATDVADVNLSPVAGGYVVEALSDAGKEVLAAAAGVLADATETHLAQKDAMRAETARQLQEQNADYEFPADVRECLSATVEDVFWRQQLCNCVQCGGCTAVCPTCYCFLLYDQVAGQNVYERVRAADSCQLTGYTPMAGAPGGAAPDPRRTHMSKFQHRITHKFCYDPENWGVVGCVGCGRCAATCPGAVDLRVVISNIKTGVSASE